MYEKLDRLRAEVAHRRRKVEYEKKKLRDSEERLKEAEDNQILADVGALNLTPEQLAEFLKLVSGKTPDHERIAQLYPSSDEVETEIKESEDEKDEED